MSANNVDFRYIREHADINVVAAHFGIKVEKDGTRAGQFRALCPFHDDETPSLKLNNQRNIFHCFVCDAGGNVIEFVQELEELKLRPAAKRVAEICGISTTEGGDKPKAPKSKQKQKATRVKEERTKPADAGKSKKSEAALDGVPINRPLTFELKNLDTGHPFIKERGLSDAMVAEFGLGVAIRGIMKDRLVFPIHNVTGELVAYCGRYLSKDVPADEAKYKQPPNFRKELECFNWHRVRDGAGTSPLVVVESFFSVVRLHHFGWRVISPMGRSMSAHQIALLKGGGERAIVLLFDGDDPGRLAVTTLGRQLLSEGFKVSAPVVPEKFKPHRLDCAELASLMN